MNQTLILVNPKARGGEFQSQWANRQKEILAALGEAQAQLVFTSADDFGAGAIRKGLLEGIKKVVVVGGDGTLSEAAQGFFEKDRNIAPDAVLMVMPSGRGDDFFKTLANERFHSGDAAWEKGLSLLREGHPTSIDVGKLSWLDTHASVTHQRYFLNITSFGFPGLVVERVQKKIGRFGKSFLGRSRWTYSIQGLAALSTYQPLDVSIKVNEAPFFSGKIHSGFILNGRYNGGGICWDPHANFRDGMFGVMVMEHRSVINYIKNTSKIMMGRRDKLPGVFRAQGKKIEVLFPRLHPKPHDLFEVDGDLFEQEHTRGAIFEVLPGALKLQI